MPACILSSIRLFATPWTTACQAPLSMGFPRWEYWSGLPIPSPGGFPNPGIEPARPAALCWQKSLPRATREAPGWQQLFPDSLGGDGECALHGNLYPGGIQGPPLPLGIAYFLKPPISGGTATWNGQPRSSPGQHPSGPLFWNQSQA